MKRWCSDCGRRQTVEDVTTEGWYAHGREMGARVEWLTCGHHWQGEERDRGPGPGAPEPLPRSYTLGREAKEREMVSPW